MPTMQLCPCLFVFILSFPIASVKAASPLNLYPETGNHIQRAQNAHQIYPLPV